MANIPLPFWGKQSNLKKEERAFQAAINAVVVTLNWLHLDQPSRVPADFKPRQPLSPEQRGIVQRLRRLMSEWAESEPVSADAMGRTAGKVESLEMTLADLAGKALKIVAASGSGGVPTSSAGVPAGGSTLMGEVQVAKEIESDRLQFGGKPAFEPGPWLSATSRAVYEDPLAYAHRPEEQPIDPPHVQVRGSRKEVLGLLKKLDRTQRLSFFLPEEVRMSYRAGLFALAKNLTLDRLILDARPANQLEEGINEWTSLMASVSPMLDISMAPGEKLIMSGEDLRDYYYYYCVTPSRAARNALAMELTAAEAQQFEAFGQATPGGKMYIPALRTMAMGDLNSVEFGQAAHTKLALSCGVNMEDMLTLRGRLPRQPFYVGIVIDDFVAMELGPDPHADSLLSTGLADKMVGLYQEVGLLAHDIKRFRQQTKAKFWGASINGDEGTIRAQLERSLPIACITAQVARLGYGNRKLLEILAGAWTAILQCRKRGMCLLESIFQEVQRFDYGKDFVLTEETVAELWTLVILSPLFVTDLRTTTAEEFSLVDASNEWEAEVATTLPLPVAKEMGRQKLTKAAWSRLLSPVKALQRLHGTLPVEEEVPEGESPARAHPMWTSVVRSRQFHFCWRKKVKRKTHINLSELSAALRCEARRGRLRPNTRLLIGSDSQVVLGALVKGRSSSSTLNRKLKQRLPGLLAYNTFSYWQYIPTQENVADDPTRNKMPREPSEPAPEWLAAVENEDFSKLDALLAERGLHDAAVARWPREDEGDPECAGRAEVGGSTSSSTVLASSGHSASSSTVLAPTEQPSSSPTVLASAEQTSTSPTVLAAAEQSSSSSTVLGKTPSSSTVLPRTGRDGGRRNRSVAAIRSFEPWLPRRRLSASAVDLLRTIPRGQFVLPRGVKLDDVIHLPGHLDLFSGCRVAAKELAERSGRWVLTYDLAHSPAEDLLDETVQSTIWRLMTAGNFMTLTAGPVCSSFSRAVRPPVRSSSEPAGVATMTAAMRSKVDAGNAMSRWLALLVRYALELKLKVWIENPAGSYLWKQVEWTTLTADFALESFTTDYCRWGTRWRKRTRFLGDFNAAGLRCLCTCSSPHIKLVGYSKEFRCCWTKAAEAYPRPLARFLAASLVESLKPKQRQRHFDLGSCAKAGGYRIGEATNPGPRRSVPLSGDLEAVQLVQPSTLALQAKVHKIFLDWLQSELSSDSWLTIVESPQLQVLFLRSFGSWLFKQGRPIYLYRHLVVFLQQQFPALRQHTVTAWELLQKWEVLLPVSHRPPLPKVVLDAMVCLALTWGWPKWAAITMLAYHGACRVGEPLKARRCDLLLPDEVGIQENICLLNIQAPKPGRRGRGRVQHTKIVHADAVKLAVSVFQDLPAQALLYPSSADSYRRRWDRLLSALQIEKSARLTPGCVRGGGAVYLYHTGQHISNIQWTMRLKSQQTLEHYLQETAAVGVFHELSVSSRSKVLSCAKMLPFILPVWIS